MSKLDWRNRACAAVLLCVTAPIGLSAQTFKTLHSFDGTDGAFPLGLVQATGGNLYGTTLSGGANNGGTVFKINPNGGPVKTLYSFCSQGGTACTDGSMPTSGLVQAPGGNFYGTAEFGGANSLCSGYAPGCGAVFKITRSGTLTLLYSFCSQGGANCTDGSSPFAGLVQATNGNFYGTTLSGGASTYCLVGYGYGTGCGTVFKITPSGTLTTLYSFAPGAEGLARMAPFPSRGWSRPPTGTCTGQRNMAGPTAMARSSKSPPVAR